MTESNNSGRNDATKIRRSELEVKADEIRLRENDKKMERARKRAPAMGMARITATSLGLVVALGCATYMLGTSSGHENKVADNNSRISQLTDDLNKVQTDLDNTPTVDGLRGSIARANERGQALLGLENDMRTVVDIGNEAEVARYSGLTDQAKVLMTKASQNGQFLPNGQWFRPQEYAQVAGKAEGLKAWQGLGPDKWAMSMLPVTDVDDKGNIPVVFEARLTGGEHDGTLIGTVKATYDPESDLFFGFKRILTQDGLNMIGGTSESVFSAEASRGETIPDPEVTDDRALIDEARKSASETTTEQAPEEGTENE